MQSMLMLLLGSTATEVGAAPGSTQERTGAKLDHLLAPLTPGFKKEPARRRQIMTFNAAFEILTGAGVCEIKGESCVENLHHDNHEECEIRIMRRGQLYSEFFDTEPGYDKITLNGETYSGYIGGSGTWETVNAGDIMRWNADWTVTHAGWRICIQNPHNRAFELITGSEFCELSGDHCVENLHHDNHEECEIRIRQSGSVSSTFFDVEANFDKITLKGQTYDGTSGPNGVEVTGGDVMTWMADHSVTHAGWRICLTWPQAWEVVSGSEFCLAPSENSNCVINYRHGNNEECEMRALRSGYVLSTFFDTEAGFDKITLKGQTYDGTSGPNGVSVSAGDVMNWRADWSVTHAGWRICLLNPYICAETHDQECECTGTVYYGRKYATGTPGSGAIASFEQTMASGTASAYVFRSIECSNAAFGGDPMYGVFKHCYCVPDQWSSVRLD